MDALEPVIGKAGPVLLLPDHVLAELPLAALNSPACSRYIRSDPKHHSDRDDLRGHLKPAVRPPVPRQRCLAVGRVGQDAVRRDAERGQHLAQSPRYSAHVSSAQYASRTLTGGFSASPIPLPSLAVLGLT